MIFKYYNGIIITSLNQILTIKPEMKKELGIWFTVTKGGFGYREIGGE